MKKNIGKIDRFIRLAVGAVLVILAAVIPFWWLLIPAAIALATAALERCPLYVPFGIRTNKNE
ncbi:MAG TPA: DUF2892 domain-containing protein [Acholeplasmatales bacterium]|nr:DUF2892 domain-containing protein [Bacillota bacterium]HAQ56609.1 DUF2892 domain-containing protein [Acholeplasmatales bacterium]